MIYMLGKLLQNDKFLSMLLRNSGLTDTQLDTILCYIVIRRLDGKLEQMLVARDGPRITKGSFLRTLKQARENLRKSIYSMLLLSYLGLIDVNFMVSFGKVIENFQELRDAKEISNPNQIIQLIDMLCDRLMNM